MTPKAAVWGRLAGRQCADTPRSRCETSRTSGSGRTGQRWCPAGDAHGAQQIGSTTGPGASIGHRLQRQIAVSRCGSGRPLTARFGGFSGIAHPQVVAVATMSREHLGDDVEVAGSCTDMRDRTQARRRAGATPFGHRADQIAIAGQGRVIRRLCRASWRSTTARSPMHHAPATTSRVSALASFAYPQLRRSDA